MNNNYGDENILKEYQKEVNQNTEYRYYNEKMGTMRDKLIYNYNIGTVSDDFEMTAEIVKIAKLVSTAEINFLIDSTGGSYYKIQMMMDAIDKSPSITTATCIRAANMSIPLLLSFKKRIGYETSKLTIKALRAHKKDVLNHRFTPNYIKSLSDELMFINEHYMKYISERTQYDFDYLYQKLVLEDQTIILHGKEALELEFFTELIKF